MVHIHPIPQVQLAGISLLSHHLLAHRQKALASNVSKYFALSLKISSWQSQEQILYLLNPLTAKEA